MGITHVVGRRAVVFTDSNGGQPNYALYERTYESNVQPRTPSWTLQWFGSAASCINRIISWAKVCEAGLIQGRDRRWTADEYITKWRSELAAPVMSSQTVLKGRFRIDGYGPGIVNWRHREALLSAISGFGEHMDGDRFRIDLARPGALQAVAEACAEGGWVPTGLFDFDESGTVPRRELGVARPGPVRPSLEGIEVFFAEDPESPRYERNFIVMIGGLGVPGGWRYSTIERFIELVVREREAARPGSAEPLLKAFSLKVASALPIPDDMTIRVDPALDPDECEYKRRATTSMIERLGADPGTPLMTTAGHARSVGALAQLAGQGYACQFRHQHADTPGHAVDDLFACDAQA